MHLPTVLLVLVVIPLAVCGKDDPSQNSAETSLTTNQPETCVASTVERFIASTISSADEKSEDLSTTNRPTTVKVSLDETESDDRQEPETETIQPEDTDSSRAYNVMIIAAAVGFIAVGICVCIVESRCPGHRAYREPTIPQESCGICSTRTPSRSSSPESMEMDELSTSHE